MQTPGPGLQVVGVERQLVRWLVYGGLALFGAFVFLTGSLLEAVVMIVIGELLMLVWRPQPNLGAATYAPPAPARWQTPIAGLRWLGLANSFWNIGVGCLFLGVFLVGMVVIAILARPHLGVANFAVLVLLGAWLGTRPLWIEPLRQTLKVSATTQVGRYLPTLSVGTEGVDVYLQPLVIAGRPRWWRFSVGFAELDEVRTLDGLSAEGYWESMVQYDPTLDARSMWELMRLLTGKPYRPPIFAMMGFGTHVLMRNATNLYLVGNADQSGPAAVVAFEAWRAAHRAPQLTH